MKKILLILGAAFAFTGFGMVACNLFGALDIGVMVVGVAFIVGGLVLVARSFGCGVKPQQVASPTMSREA